MRSILAPILFVLLASPVLAIGTEESPGASTAQAQAAADAGDYAGALALLRPIVAAEPGNADALNLVGFASRKLGQLDQAASFYEAALAVDPNHQGALEYQGELFVMTGNLAGAQANLAKLQALCGTCEAEEDLAAALAGAGS
jgi:Flp pilus assembly protein TadD